mgnify:CR=1 FL=1
MRLVGYEDLQSLRNTDFSFMYLPLFTLGGLHAADDIGNALGKKLKRIGVGHMLCLRLKCIV